MSKFHPRPYQLKVLKALNNGIKRIIWICHRRAGKDLTIYNWCIEQLIARKCSIYYIFPTYAQAKKVIWDSLTNDGMRILDYLPNEFVLQKNAQEMKIRLKNGSLFQLLGSKDIDKLMGTNPHIVVFSEYAMQDPAAWDYIRPILKINNGIAIFISTPRGRNHFYDLYNMAQDYKSEWWTEKLSYKDTGVLTDKDIEDEISQGMSEELALQEYSCSFERGIDGAYYAKLINKMREEDKIGAFSYDPYKIVHTAWDIGWDDATSIIFFQLKQDQIRIIDHEEHQFKTLDFYKKLLDKKGYRYGTHLFPHDTKHVDGLSTGLSRMEILQDLNIPPTIVPLAYIIDGIHAVCSIMSSRLYINEKCEKLIKSLENYHREYDANKKVYKDKPNHNWASHSSDSLRYLCTGLHLLDTQESSCAEDFKALKKYWG